MRVNSRSSTKRAVIRFLGNESGATAIEYGLIAGLISLVIISTITVVGTKLNVKFIRLSNGLN